MKRKKIKTDQNIYIKHYMHYSVHALYYTPHIMN